jgi:GNAT superfamily N-acetyltransferase
MNTKLIASKNIEKQTLQRVFSAAIGSKKAPENITFLGEKFIKPLKLEDRIYDHLFELVSLPEPRYIYLNYIQNKDTQDELTLLAESTFGLDVNREKFNKANEHLVELQSTKTLNFFHFSHSPCLKTVNYFVALHPQSNEIISSLKLKYSFLTNRYTIEGYLQEEHETSYLWQKRGIGTLLMKAIINFALEQRSGLRVNYLRNPKWKESLIKLGFDKISDIFTDPHYTDLLYKV